MIGRLVADRLEGKMEESLKNKFAVDRPLKKKDVAERELQHRLRPLNVEELSGPGDF